MQNQVSQNLVELTVYNEMYKKELEQFTLPPEQEKFTGMPKDMIELAKVDATRNPIVILNGDRPVGFFVLQGGERVAEYTDNSHALLLIAFSINEQEQGRGFAKKGLLLLPNFIKENFAEVNEVVLAVNMKNTAARKLYEKVGFLDNGQRRLGPIGEQAVLNLSI